MKSCWKAARRHRPGVGRHAADGLKHGGVRRIEVALRKDRAGDDGHGGRKVLAGADVRAALDVPGVSEDVVVHRVVRRGGVDGRAALGRPAVQKDQPFERLPDFGRAVAELPDATARIGFIDKLLEILAG